MPAATACHDRHKVFCHANKVRALFESRGIQSVAADGFKAPGVVVSYTSDADIQNSKKFLALGLQTAAGVPLQCDEPADFSSFRVRLFGLEKLHKSECAHQLDQPIRMLALTGRRCRRLFYQGGVLLRHVIELHHRGVDVVDAGTLRDAGQGDFASELRDLFGRLAW